MLELHSTEQSLLVLTERKKKGKSAGKKKKKKGKGAFWKHFIWDFGCIVVSF